jgi:hypothetical protein
LGFIKAKWQCSSYDFILTGAYSQLLCG